MTLYKLKLEARQFLSQRYHTKIEDKFEWAKMNVPLYLLEEVPQNRVQLGYNHGNGETSLSGHDTGFGAKYYFTLHMPLMTNKQYNEFNISELQDKFNDIVKNIKL